MNLSVFAVLLAGLLLVGWSPTASMAVESYPRRIATWDPIVTETIEKYSLPGDYVLAPGVPTIPIALGRKHPYLLAGPSDTIVPYLPALPPQAQIESLRQELERNLPKVCYFPIWFRAEQKMCHELLYQPLLKKYNYIKVDDTLWYLAEGESVSQR